MCNRQNSQGRQRGAVKGWGSTDHPLSVGIDERSPDDGCRHDSHTRDRLENRWELHGDGPVQRQPIGGGRVLTNCCEVVRDTPPLRCGVSRSCVTPATPRTRELPARRAVRTFQPLEQPPAASRRRGLPGGWCAVPRASSKAKQSKSLDATQAPAALCCTGTLPAAGQAHWLTSPYRSPPDPVPARPVPCLSPERSVVPEEGRFRRRAALESLLCSRLSGCVFRALLQSNPGAA